jgi:hypothetical protein
MSGPVTRTEGTNVGAAVGSIVVAALVAALDAALFVGALDGPHLGRALGSAIPVGLALLLRPAFGLIAAVVLLAGAPPKVRREGRAFLLLAGLLVTLIPVVATIGLLALIHVGFARPARSPVARFEAIEVELAVPKTIARPDAAPSPTRLAAILRDHSPASAERRFRAVLATKALPAKRAIALLKVAQRDPTDEVRLYAFSRIEKVRDELERSLKALHDRLAESVPDERAAIELRLAEANFELAHLGLADGAVRAATLERAEAHATRATEGGHAGATARLYLGRIRIERGDWAGALVALGEAQRLGAPPTQVLPLQAECAFRLRQFDLVRTFLHELGASRPGSVWANSELAPPRSTRLRVKTPISIVVPEVQA